MNFKHFIIFQNYRITGNNVQVLYKPQATSLETFRARPRALDSHCTSVLWSARENASPPLPPGQHRRITRGEQGLQTLRATGRTRCRALLAAHGRRVLDRLNADQATIINSRGAC